MMMINDLTLANEAVGDWSVTTHKKRQRRREAGELYHVRILMGHVYEALKLLQHIAADLEILDAVLACDREPLKFFFFFFFFFFFKKKKKQKRSL